MTYFVIILLFGLTLTPLVVSQTMDFCTKYLNLSIERGRARNNSRTDYAVPNLKFIATKDVLYLYLDMRYGVIDPKEELVYKLDVSCNTTETCPQIGAEEKFTDVFKGMNGLKDAFLHEGFTYFFTNGTNQVVKYENTIKKEEIPEADFLERTTHATVYKWENNKKIVLSRFIPPKVTKISRSVKTYQYSFDTFRGDLTVEVKGNNSGVNFVNHIKLLKPYYLTLYSFDDYLVPTQFYGYLPLPNGDDIFNFETYPGYVRKDEATVNMHRTQNLNQILCKTTTIEDKILSDTQSDNIYPKYFNNN